MSVFPRKKYCIFGCDALVAYNIPLHRFPDPSKRPDLFAAWASAVGDKLKETDHRKIYRNKRICDQHFDRSTKVSGGRLIWSAIPTVLFNGGILHVFPNRKVFPEQFEAWSNLVPEHLRPAQNDFHNKRVCDRHFTDQNRNRNKRLNGLAIPTLYLPGVQQSLITFVESDHSYCHPRRELSLLGSMITKPDPSAVESLTDPLGSGVLSPVDTIRSTSPTGMAPSIKRHVTKSQMKFDDIKPDPSAVESLTDPLGSGVLSPVDIRSTSPTGLARKKSQMKLDEAPNNPSIVYDADAVFCRCCLQECAAELSMFSPHGSTVLYADMLLRCCSLEVSASDGKPSHICFECSKKLQASYYFNEMCLRTDSILNSEQLALADPDGTESMMFEHLGENFISEDSNDLLKEVKDKDVFEDAEDQVKDAKMNGKVKMNGEIKKNGEVKIQSRKVEFEGANADETLEGSEFEWSDLETVTNYKSEITSTKEQSNTKCDICNITFGATKEWRDHMDQHGSYKCDCGATFVFLYDMHQHRRYMHNEQGYQCEHCSKSFSSKGSLELHVTQFHTHLKPYPCNTCKMNFDSRNKLRDHKLKTGHGVKVIPKSRNSVIPKSQKSVIPESRKSVIPKPRNSMNKCELCEKRCHSSSRLKEHIDWVHRGVKFYCHICQKDYTSKSIHMAMNHGDGKQCNVCGEWFASKSQHHDHCRQKHRSRRRRCACGAWLYSDREHTCGNRLVCQYCAKMFKSTSGLNLHLKTHTEKEYQCDICTKMFSHRGALGRHRERHTNPKSIMCDYCPSMFRTRKDLSSHLARHIDGTKPHACRVCGKAFRRPDHRNIHQRNVHGVIDTKL